MSTATKINDTYYKYQIRHQTKQIELKDFLLSSDVFPVTEETNKS